MVLESIVGERNIRKHPVMVFFLTLLICAGSILFAQMLFPAHASVLSVAFITIGLAPLVYNVLSNEEAHEAFSRKHFTTFFARHFNVIMMYVWIFIGVIVAFSFYYGFLPAQERNSLFDEQIKSFCVLAGSDSCKGGLPISAVGRAASFGFESCLSQNSNIPNCTWFIFENNAGVLIFAVVLSLLYGVGALFIIVWNASILGVFFAETFMAGNFDKLLGMSQSMLLGHGPPELLGYVFGALAGAILSAVVARGELFAKDSWYVIRDVLFLGGLGIFSVAYGAVTEAVGILKYSELYFILGFVYLIVVIIAVYLYGSPPKQIRFGFD